MKTLQLRDYQEAGVDGLRAGFRAGVRKQVLVAPTGAGKTELATHMLAESKKRGKRSLFIVDRTALVDQTSARLDSYGIEHGVIQSGHWRRRSYELVQVASAQTLERRGIPAGIELIFVDEAHSMRKAITNHIRDTDAFVVGLTATPFARGLGEAYGGLVNVTTTNRLIASGHLVPLTMYAARSIATEGLRVVGGEWAAAEVAERGMGIVGDVVSEWQDKTEKHFGGPVKTLVFAADVRHGAELVRQFKAAGFAFEQISYRDGDDDHRRALIAEFRKPDSKIVGLVSCEVLTKGFDVADVRCGIAARPYRKSLSSHMQQLGRVMRPAPGKSFGLWLDHAGNVSRFRRDVEEVFANGVRSLAAGALRERKARKDPNARERERWLCDCGCLLSPFDDACRGCGKERRRASTVHALPGRMFEETGEPGKKGPPPFLADRDAVWDQLCCYARTKRTGNPDLARRLAFAKFKALYGGSANPSRGYNPWSTATPSKDLANYLLHLDIKYRAEQRSARKAASA